MTSSKKVTLAFLQ